MSPKQRKKAPRAKKQTSSASDSSSVTSAVIATTNYREIHLNEVEALRSIYGDDYEEVENRRSAWQVGGFGLDIVLERLSDL
jgi:eukaryotic translation initiation factor 2-alpha kinase 4